MASRLDVWPHEADSLAPCLEADNPAPCLEAGCLAPWPRGWMSGSLASRLTVWPHASRLSVWPHASRLDVWPSASRLDVWPSASRPLGTQIHVPALSSHRDYTLYLGTRSHLDMSHGRPVYKEVPVGGVYRGGGRRGTYNRVNMGHIQPNRAIFSLNGPYSA